MGESRKQFLEWWNHPEQAELRKSCAEGWGEKIWSASRSAIAIELPEPFKMAKSSSGLTYYYQDEVDAVLSCAGIKVKE
ncbi:hypothetical protein MMN01_000166 [Escherichia coli]|nr:hypothetical protein [Escherichia coli]EIY3350237.1 hypothetical protein [Escherichia coli]